MLPRSPPSLHNLFTTTLENDFRIPPLNAQRFNGSFEHFCTVKGLVLDHEPLHMGEKEVNLHSLHSEVMGHQGYNVNERRLDFWLEIGRQLDFIDPLDTSPTATGIANRLATIYERYLEQFDRIYVVSYVQELQHRESLHMPH